MPHGIVVNSTASVVAEEPPAPVPAHLTAPFIAVITATVPPPTLVNGRPQ